MCISLFCSDKPSAKEVTQLYIKHLHHFLHMMALPATGEAYKKVPNHLVS